MACMHVSHKIRIYPNKDQIIWLRKACGASRFTYNWGLDKWTSMYEEWKLDNTKSKPTRFTIQNELNKIKHQDFKWITEVSDQPAQCAIEDLDKAFKNLFRGAGYPNKKNRNSRFSFRMNVRANLFQNNKLKLRGLDSLIKMSEQFRFKDYKKICFVTISCKNNRWYASITAELEDKFLPKAIESKPIGIDLGLTTLATLSNGQKITKRKITKKQSKRLKVLNRRLSKKQKGSKNRAKAKLKLALYHEKLANIRENDIQNITAALAQIYQDITLENLNIKNMMKNHRLAGVFSDAALFRFKSELMRKVKARDGIVREVGTFFPSSKLCSACGFKNDNLKLSDRIWTCQGCGECHDRDINAAKNLATANVVRPTRPDVKPVEKMDSFIIDVKVDNVNESISGKQEVMTSSFTNNLT